MKNKINSINIARKMSENPNRTFRTLYNYSIKKKLANVNFRLMVSLKTDVKVAFSSWVNNRDLTVVNRLYFQFIWFNKGLHLEINVKY